MYWPGIASSSDIPSRGAASSSTGSVAPGESPVPVESPAPGDSFVPTEGSVAAGSADGVDSAEEAWEVVGVVSATAVIVDTVPSNAPTPSPATIRAIGPKRL